MRIVGGRYRVERVLGEGGQGTVFLAHDLHLERAVALKTLRPGQGDPAEACRCFLREGRLLAAVDHPGLARVLDCLEEGGQPWLVMEWVDGRTLETVAATHPGPLPRDLVLGWAAEIAEALDYLHSRRPPLLFLDLKPGNIMVERSGRLKLVDFGIARRVGAAGPTTGLVGGLGTPGFAALEQYAGRAEPRSDVHALGATIHALLNGSPPPDAAARAAGQERLGAGPAALRSMLALRPEDRPFPATAAMRALATELRRPGTDPPLRYCPHRDGRGPVGASPANLAWAVAYQGPEPLARQAARLAERDGLRAVAVPGELRATGGPAPWIVLLRPRSTGREGASEGQNPSHHG